MRKNSTRFGLLFVCLLFSPFIFSLTFTVTNTNDLGTGSLRQALVDANNSAGTDNIVFNISGGGQGSIRIITLASPLTVNSAVIINGYTQGSAAAGPNGSRTILVGIQAPGTDAFNILSGSVTISGIAVYNCQRAFVFAAPTGNLGAVRVQGCYVGLLATGLPGTGNAISQSGMYVEADNATYFDYSSPRLYIGTDGDGVNDANEGNVISNCGTAGIFFAVANGIAVAGNYIGTTAAGAAGAVGNGVGIIMDGQFATAGSSFNRIGTNGDGISDALEGNVISGNSANGILLRNIANSNRISGNIVGLNAAGTAVAANGSTGIQIDEGSNNTIGVSTTGGLPVQGNIISGNGGNGIRIASGLLARPSNNNNVMGNYIGTNASNASLGNGSWGVYIFNSGTGQANSNIIGSNDDGTNDNGEANVIAFNAQDGIGLLQSGASNVINNRISRNSFFSNGTGANSGLGINLITAAGDGITINSTNTAGANTLFNYPVITGIGYNDQVLSIQGTAPNRSIIQFYISSDDAAPSNPNFKEGRYFLINGTDNGPEDLANQQGTFNFSFPRTSLAYNLLTTSQTASAIAFSTASGAGNTSEFSQISLALLPAQFVSFDAQLQGDKVLVNWATAQEQNASHYEVQKSTDGRSFSTIGSVNAKGNSFAVTSYSFTDNNVSQGVSYYRLRQVDLDAKYVYTKTVPIRNEGKGRQFQAWPNPATDILNLTLNQTKPEKLVVKVVDLNGKTLRTNPVTVVRGINQISLNVAELPKGMYLIQVTGGETTLNQKFLKN